MCAHMHVLACVCESACVCMVYSPMKQDTEAIDWLQKSFCFTVLLFPSEPSLLFQEQVPVILWSLISSPAVTGMYQ